MEINFRPCGECTECCNGSLEHRVYGNYVGNFKPCSFLVSKDCTIYKDRPQTCSNYQCAWTQNLLPEDMRPDKSGVLVSVEFDQDKKQYLKVIELKDVVEFTVYNEIDAFTKQNDTYWTKVPFKKVIPIHYEKNNNS